MDCHTSKEVHGSGIKYNSMKDIDFFETACLDCHKDRGNSRSHYIHQEKLACEACHNKHVISCTNCHMDTLVKNGKKVSIPMSGWLFLMNYNGKVTSATTQTYIVDNDKTFIMFAPQHSHLVMPKGRKCKDCHATLIVNEMLDSRNLKVTWMEKGEIKNLKGVIPVAKDVTYDFIYQNYEDEKWFLIENPDEPKIHYVGNGTPLTEKQLEKVFNILLTVLQNLAILKEL